MSWKEISLVCLALIATSAALPAASASDATISDLLTTISSFEDPAIDVSELAFYLASHSYSARPNGGFVEVEIGGKIYKLTPNGSEANLCSIAMQL